MAEAKAPSPGSNEDAEVRRKALIRLAVAGGVTLAALATLWWLDRGGKPDAKPKPVRPLPIASAPAQVKPPVEATPLPEALVQPETLPETPAETPSASMSADEPPKTAPPPPEIGIRPVARPAEVARSPVRMHSVEPIERAEPARSSQREVLPPPVETGFVVQLGVFANPQNAQEMVERLRQQGIRAYTETRVHVGPFHNREEAERAQAQLKRLGLSGLVGSATRK